MNIGFLSIWEQTNYRFFNDNSELDFGDDLFKHMMALQKFGQDQGVNINYVGEFEIGSLNAIVFHEMPNLNNEYFQYAMKNCLPIFLFAIEPVVVYPPSHDIRYHELFTKILTPYNLYIEKGSKYVKIYPFCFEMTIQPKRKMKTNFCVLINSNKSSNHPLELYSERVNTIRWFESHHPDQFDLYGHGWRNSEFSSYRGIAKKKQDTLSRYKFAICYENTKDVSGYITEKIFDCLFAGCVPVYWGAPDILEHIPENCFIDRRKFASNEDLYNFLNDIDSGTYEGYLREAEKYLKSEKANEFSINTFVQTFYNTLIEGIDEYNLNK